MMRPRIWQKQFLILLLFVSGGNPVQAGQINPLPTDTAVGILLGLALVLSLLFLSFYGFLRGLSELNKEFKIKSVNTHVFYLASVNYMEPCVSFGLIGIFTFFQTSQHYSYYLLSILTFLSLITSFLPIEGSKNVQNLISNLRFITILRMISVVFSYLEKAQSVCLLIAQRIKQIELILRYLKLFPGTREFGVLEC
jgi:hypothetical protein